MRVWVGLPASREVTVEVESVRITHEGLTLSLGPQPGDGIDINLEPGDAEHLLDLLGSLKKFQSRTTYHKGS